MVAAFGSGGAAQGFQGGGKDRDNHFTWVGMIGRIAACLVIILLVVFLSRPQSLVFDCAFARVIIVADL